MNLIKKLKEGIAQKDKATNERRKNFFQRKRFVNYDMNMGVGNNNGEEEDESELGDAASAGQQHHYNEGGIGPHSNSKQKHNVVDFEEDPVIGGGRGHHLPHNNHQGNAHFPPQPSSHIQPALPHEELRRPVSKLPPLETKSQAFDMVSPQQQPQQPFNNAY